MEESMVRSQGHLDISVRFSKVWSRGFFLGLMLMCGSLGMAQLDTGTISGTVADQSGAAVPGAAVTIRNVDTGINRTLVTSSAGRYEAAALPGGNYEVRASLAGFQTLVRSGITLAVGRTAVVDLALQVGEVAQAITVIGEASNVETTTATVAHLVDEKRVTEIPLNNRDLTNLAFFQPGVLKMPINPNRAGADVSIAGGGQKLTVAGARAYQNVYLLDGVSNSDVSGNVQSVAGTYEGAETIKEFQVITNNYSAEYPSKPGAIISAVTKSGTNSFHGSAYEFLRNDNLDAARWEDNAFTGAKPEFKRNQFGGSLGGPIFRDKTFFFAAYEGMRERQSTTETATTISAAARTGNLGRNGFQAVNPKMVPFLALFDLPGDGNTVGTDFGDGTVRVAGSGRNPVRNDFGTIKVDHQFATARKGFLAVTYNTSDATRDSLRILSADDSWGTASRKHVVAARHTSVLSSAVLNEFAFGITHAKTTVNIPITEIDFTNFNGADVRFRQNTPYMGNLDPDGTGIGVNDIGFGPRASHYGLDTVLFKDHLSVTRQSHTLKFGAEYQRIRIPVNKEPDGANGRYVFDSLSLFLQGFPSAFDVSLPAGAQVLGLTNLADSVFNLRLSQYGFFFQDNWKLASSLTLNLGLRYEFQTELTEENDHLSSFRDFYGSQVTVGGPFFKNPTLKNFSPRFGFAWAPGDRKMSVRGGWAIFYDPISVPQYQFVLSQLAPYLGEGGLLDRASSGAINFPNAFATQPGQLASAPNYRQFEFEPDPAYSYRWSLGLDRELGKWFISTGYTGSRALHLTVTGEANLKRWEGWPNNVPSADKRWPATAAPLINPAMSRITVTNQKGNSYYHGLTLNVQRRFAAGLTFQGAFTYSKAIDTSSSPGNNTEGYSQPQRTALMWDMDHWKGRSSFDIRSNFVTNVTWDVPSTGKTGWAGAMVNGWQINSIVTLSAGHAYTLFDTSSQQRSAMVRADGLRPNLIPGGDNHPVLERGTELEWGGVRLERQYDPSQFVPSVCFGARLCQVGDSDYLVGKLGNLGYNTLTSPGLFTADFSLNKNFQLAEEKRLQFRTEFFNLFNRPNFDIPNVNDLNPYVQSGTRLAPNPTAGVLTATRTSARQIQFGMRFSF